jgi:hypothetical protein
MPESNAADSALAAFSTTVDKPRLNSWALLCLFSTLALTAHETDDEAKNDYVTACTAITLSFSAIASMAHVSRGGFSTLFVGTIVEGLLSLILLALWAAGLPIIMDPANGLAQMYVGKDDQIHDYQATISNANLYFTAWGCGICAVSVFAMYVRERLGGSGGMGMSYTANWYWLMFASIIVVIETLRFKHQVCELENGAEDVTCGRNTYGLITGIIGLVVSFLISVFSSCGKDSALVTTISGFVMAVLYTLCAGLLTFENGPATYVGNLYFSAWAGFYLSFMVFGSVLKEFLGVGGGAASSSAAASGQSEGDDVEMDRI